VPVAYHGVLGGALFVLLELDCDRTPCLRVVHELVTAADDLETARREPEEEEIWALGTLAIEGRPLGLPVPLLLDGVRDESCAAEEGDVGQGRSIEVDQGSPGILPELRDLSRNVFRAEPDDKVLVRFGWIHNSRLWLTLLAYRHESAVMGLLHDLTRGGDDLRAVGRPRRGRLREPNVARDENEKCSKTRKTLHDKSLPQRGVA
jgi:hypothetical protein